MLVQPLIQCRTENYMYSLLLTDIEINRQSFLNTMDGDVQLTPYIFPWLFLKLKTMPSEL